MLILIDMVDRTRTSSCFKHFYAITVVVILLQLNVNPSIGCIQRERQALLALKRGFVDDSNRLSSWGSREAGKQDCCTWEGVRCSNRTGHVVELHLGYQYAYLENPLGGKLTPEALTEFQNLKYLDLSYNAFSGSLPSELGNLTNLQYLDLSENSFSGILPSELGNLSNLQYLDLSENLFSGILPSELGNLTNLQYLHLGWNQFTKVENLNWLPKLSSLQYLDLSHVNLSHVFDWSEAVDKLPELRNLSLRVCDLPPPSIVSSVSKTNLSHSLAHVHISGSPAIASSIFEWLFNHNSSLVYLGLSSIRFSGSLPSKLGNLTNLQYLYLYDTEVENLNWLPNLSSLQYLDIYRVNLSHVFEWSEAVDKLPQLRNLSLVGCDLPPPSIVSSVSKTNLSHSLAHVDISSNPAITSSIFKWLFNYNYGFVYLNLNNNGLSGQISELLEILSKCAQNSLEVLDLSYNYITGSLPNLTNFQSLEVLYLHFNKLNGTIPASIGQMPKLNTIFIGRNSLQGEVSEVHFSKLSNLRYLDLSSNSLVLNFPSDWVPPFQLESIFLTSCKMGPYFPQWLRTQKHYIALDISGNEISGLLPDWFWGQSPNLGMVDLSANKFTGLIATSSRPKFSHGSRVNLSHNQFEGPIPSFLSGVSSLDLSDNRFSGLTSFLCATGASGTMFLNISSNRIAGELPDCWMHYADLIFLDLSHNALLGKVPTTMGSLSSIRSLKLNNNRFVGELPSSLKNCRNLTLLDVGENKLSGPIPEWLGSGLPNLAIFMFRSNQFNGSMPRQLCYSIQARILDFSGNNISGTIPSCLNNLTTLAQQGNSNLTVEHEYSMKANFHGNSLFLSEAYYDEASFVSKGALRDYKSILGLVKRIDLSSNRITGKIPSEITQLVGLVSLNLSRNHLTGEIPPEMGKLKSLDDLDLSRNQIHGPIPTSLSRIDQLSVLDLSHNNLSGEIPVGTQLQRQDESNYAANPLLCGPPLERKCTPKEAHQEQQISVNHQGNLVDDELITQEFFLSMGLGFAVGFWAVFGTFLHKYLIWSMILSFFKGLVWQPNKNEGE